jgi:hypothetical protein
MDIELDNWYTFGDLAIFVSSEEPKGNDEYVVYLHDYKQNKTISEEISNLDLEFMDEDLLEMLWEEWTGEEA